MRHLGIVGALTFGKAAHRLHQIFVALAGQSYEYLVEAMRRFAEGERTNNPDMVKIMQELSPTQREAIARYISSL